MEYKNPVPDLGPPLWKLGKYGLESAELCGEILLMLLPIWVSVVVGLLVGWSWKPRWVSLIVVALRSRPRLAWSLPPGFGARRIWLAATAAAAAPAVREVWARFLSWIKDTSVKFNDKSHLESDVVPIPTDSTEPSRESFEGAAPFIDDTDLNELYNLLDEKDGGPTWTLLMDKVAKGMTYKAWRRDPINGPTEYRSQTIIESCDPEMMRDFFWDDEFRPEWDDMLTFAKTLQECERTGFQVVQWVRKFPFFCKDREYVIGRRIFSRGNTYYCVTKGVDHPSAPPRPSPRRVSVFYSSWRIRPLENGSVEILLFHKEDMGIQRDVAKLGVRQGMWGAVRKLEPGFRAYHQIRSSNSRPMSRCASMASFHTPIPPASNASLSRAWKSVSDLASGPSGSPRMRGTRSVSFRDLPSTHGSYPELQTVAESPSAEGSEENVEDQMGNGKPPSRNATHNGMKKLGVIVFGTCLAAAFGVDKAIVCKVVLAGLVQKLLARHGNPPQRQRSSSS